MQRTIDSDEAGRLIASVDRLIWKLVRRRFGGRCEHFQEDAAAEVRASLADALPNHDPRRGKLSTYFYGCIRRRLRMIAKREARKRRHHRGVDPLPRNVAAPDSSADRHVEALAEVVLNEPQRFLTRRQAQVLRHVTSHPNEPRAEAARRLGIKPKALSAILARIRRRLIELPELENLPTP